MRSILASGMRGSSFAAACAKRAAASRATSKRVSRGRTWILPMTSRVTSPRRRGAADPLRICLPLASEQDRTAPRPSARGASVRPLRAPGRRVPALRAPPAPSPESSSGAGSRARLAAQQGEREIGRRVRRRQAPRGLTLLVRRLERARHHLGGESLRVAGTDGVGARRRGPAHDRCGLAQESLQPERSAGATSKTSSPLRPARTGAARRCCSACAPGKVGVHDELELGEVEPARGDVRGDEHARAAVAHRLEGARRSCCASSPESATTSKPRSDEARRRAAHASRVARKTSAVARLERAQHVHERVLTLARRDDVRLVRDVRVRAPPRRRRDARGIASCTSARQIEDRARQRRREEQVRRSAGAPSSSVSSSSRKPMSSISSASSRTRAWTASRSSAPRSR